MADETTGTTTGTTGSSGSTTTTGETPASTTTGQTTNAATAGQTTTGATQTTTNPPTTETAEGEEEFDRERAMKTIRTLREEAKAAVKQIKEAETLRARVKEIDDAKLSEQERLTKRAEEAETKLTQAQKHTQDRINRYEVQLQASKLGIVDPDAAVKLLDWDRLEYADDGTPRDVDAALKALLADRPYLAAAPQQQQRPASQASATNGATRQTAPGSRTYARAELDDYAFYSKNREDIQLAYKEGRITG